MLKPYFETELGTLYHGDCLEIMPQLEPVDLVLTDPPYGMKWTGQVSPGPNGNPGRKREKPVKITGDNSKIDLSHLLSIQESIIWGFHHFNDRLPNGSVLVWIKRFDNAFGSFLSDADLAWMKGGCGVYCFRDTSLKSSILNGLHPTQKPLPLIRWCLGFSKTFGIVLDPYLGSGTTAVACEQLNRRWIGIEISEKYCEIAAKRIERERQQLKLFEPVVEYPKPTQNKLF